MSRRWTRLRAIVEEAFGLTDEERAGWLDRECGDDAELRAEAQALVDAALEDERFMESEPAVLRAPPLVAGDRVGPYRLLRLVATGGMGSVFLAERDEPRRRVALKLMRTGLSGPDSAARFRYEVEVLAKLTHPHIAALYETGVHVEDGRELPWFAMEYIEDARPLTAYSREEGLGLRDRLGLFADLCDAVHHGHAHGVLHRDLKPENLLVGRNGRCKVIDFGVARATDAGPGAAPLRTTTGEIVGTIHYMSPEQVEGDRDSLDIRSDVYALGVVLYELLTGALPYDVKGAGTFAAMRTIREAPPVRPGEIRPELRGDLETILLMCLAKEPAQRYGSAAALAQDLRRFLRHEPIAAHPPSVTYQLRVFARRHRALVLAVVVVVFVSLAAAVVSVTYGVSAGRSERIALAERERSAELFETLFERSTDTSARFVPRLMELSGASPIVSEMTQANLEDLRALEQLAAGDPRARSLLAKAYLQVGAIQGDPDAAANLGDLAATIRAYEQAVSIARDLHEAGPDDDDALYLYAIGLASLGYAEAHAGDHETGRVKLEGAEGLLAGYVLRHPDLRNPARTYAKVHLRLSAVAGLAKDAEAHRHHAERAIALRLAAAERWPEDAGIRLDLALSHTQLAKLHQAAGEPEKALRAFDASIVELDRLLPDDPDNTFLRQSQATNLLAAGTLETNTGRHARAADLLKRGVDLLVALRARDPGNRQLPMRTLIAQYSFAHVCVKQAEVEADEEARRAFLVRARDAYGDMVEHYEGTESGHGGLAARVRERYEVLQAELEKD